MIPLSAFSHRQRLLGRPVIAETGGSETYTDKIDTFGADSEWALGEASGTAFADRIGSFDGVGSGELEYVNDTLAQLDAGGRCIGFGGGANTSVVTIASNAAFSTAAGCFFALIQPDVIGTQQQIMTRRDTAGGAAGDWTFEITAAGVLQASMRDASNVSRTVAGTTVLTAGEAYHVLFDWGAAGIRILLNGDLEASQGTPTTSWSTSGASAIRIGRYFTGASGFNGLIGHVGFRASQTAGGVGNIALPRGVSILSGADLGSVNTGSTTTIDPHDYGHFKGTLTPNVTANAAGGGSASVNGGVVEYAAGGSGATDDTFSFTVTDDRGTTSAAQFTVDVSASTEYITHIEDQASWNGNPADYTATTAAFNEAIDDASTNAGAGRGVIELVQGRVYVVHASSGPNANVDNVNPALVIDVDNVEIRTVGKPSIASGNQAIIRFRSWTGQTGVKLRALLGVKNADNVHIYNVEFDGNKLSTGANLAAREAWLTEGGGATYVGTAPKNVGGNGGLFNIMLYGGSGLHMEDCYSHDAICDGIYLYATLAVIKDVLVKKCHFRWNRRQGASVYTCGELGGAADQVVFEECLFDETGDQSTMPGESPGAGVDVEPITSTAFAAKVTGLTFLNNTMSNNHGGSWEKGGPHSGGVGRGLTTQFSIDMVKIRIIGNRFADNDDEACKLNSRRHKTYDEWTVSDNIVESNNGTNAIIFDSGSAPDNDNSILSNCLVVNNNTPLIDFRPALANTGHSALVYRGDFPSTTVNKNGQETITVSNGFPP